MVVFAGKYTSEGVRGLRPNHNFLSKNFLFLLPFVPEAFKTCKNTIQLLKRFLPYMFKGRLSSWPSAQTLNIFIKWKLYLNCLGGEWFGLRLCGMHHPKQPLFFMTSRHRNLDSNHIRVKGKGMMRKFLPKIISLLCPNMDLA